MKALILAAGKGTRLRPLTNYVPKPLVPIHGKPLLEWILLHLISYGIREFVIAVSYLAEQIQNYFRDGQRWKVSIKYSYGSAPAGKAGEIWRAREWINNEQQFLVVPGDTITHLDYHDLIRFHEQHAGMVSVALSTRYRLEIGLAQVDESNQITGFWEKANLGRPVSTGTYLLDQAIFTYIERFCPAKNEVDLPGEVFPVLLKEKIPIYGFVSDYEWWDIGRMNDLETLVYMPFKQAASVLYGNSDFLEEGGLCRQRYNETF